jgi:hypothetical protein
VTKVLTSTSIPAMFLLRPADTKQTTDKHKKNQEPSQSFGKLGNKACYRGLSPS